MRKIQKHTASRNGRKAQHCQNWALHFPKGGQPSAAHCSNQLHCSKRNIQQNSIQLIESEGFYNQWAKSRNSTTRDSGSSQQKPFPIELDFTYEIVSIKENQSHDLMSRAASFTWSHFHSWVSMPCWFMRSLSPNQPKSKCIFGFGGIKYLSIATSLSSSGRNFAVIGESGMKKLQ